MKQSHHFSLAGLLLVSCSALSAVPAEGWYAGLMGTGSYSPSVSPTVTDPVTDLSSITTRASLSYKIGGGGGGQVGYRFCNFRVEGELFLDYNPYQKITVGNVTFKHHFVPFPTPDFGVRMKGNTSLGAGLINAYYEIFDEDDDPSFVPYLGLGVGYARVQNKIRFYTITQPTGIVSNTAGKEHRNTPIGQVILGLSRFYNDNLSFNLDYRYLTTRNITHNTANTAATFDTRVQVHTLNLSFNYTFSDSDLTSYK